MRTAIIHDWLTVYAGGERVLEQLLQLYPHADLFTICDFLPEKERGFLGGRIPRTTFIQKLPGARRWYRSYLPLMPLAIEQLDLSGYDIVISSSHAVAKGVLTGPDQVHVSYVHSPIRYAWDLQHEYLRQAGLDHGVKAWISKWLLHRMRLWDLRTANGVDQFVANSQFIARRIRKVYRRDAEVIYTPVDVSNLNLCTDKDDFYLTASRLVPYKRLDLVVQAFAQMPKRRLVVIGDGPERAKIERLAAGRRNIEILGYQPNDVLAHHLERAKAFVFAAEEDFGIMPVEAQACGTPVIAFGKGGALETIRDLKQEDPTGIFFSKQTSESILQAVDLFEEKRAVFEAGSCRANAERFSSERFREAFLEIAERAYSHFVRER